MASKIFYDEVGQGWRYNCLDEKIYWVPNLETIEHESECEECGSKLESYTETIDKNAKPFHAGPLHKVGINITCLACKASWIDEQAIINNELGKVREKITDIFGKKNAFFDSLKGKE